MSYRSNVSPRPPSSSMTSSQPLLKAMAIIIIMVMSFLFMVPSAAGYTGSPRFSKGSTLEYCIHSDFTQTRRDTITEAIERFDAQANALNMVYVDYAAGPNTGVLWNNCELRVVYGSDTEFNGLTNNISIVSSTLWWYEGPNYCYWTIGNSCSGFALSMVMHEVGHWLGFGHQGVSGVADCRGGYWVDYVGGAWHAYGTHQVVAGCWEHYATRVMYANAGDGYYRALDADTINGINAWYDW